MIDFHIHLSPEIPAASETAVRYAHGVPAYTERPILGDTDRLLDLLEGSGVTTAVLSSGRGLRGGVEGTRAANEALAAVCEQHPGRLRFMAHAATPTEPGALDEVERWLDVCPGAAVPSGWEGVQLDDERLEPLYALLEERRRFLWVHPALAVTEAEAEVYDAYDLHRTVGREFSLVISTLRIVLGGVLDRHPSLNVVISHLGGGIVSLLSRIEGYQDKAALGLSDDPVHGKTCERPFEEYLRRLYFDTGGFFADPAAVELALTRIPRERIVLGSDYPQEIRTTEPLRALVDALSELGLADNGRELLEPTTAGSVRGDA